MLSAFTSWSRNETSEIAVSDKYVALGNEFNKLKGELRNSKLSSPHLIDVPVELRRLLEPALAQPATPAVATEFVPKIESVMAQLFNQLSEMQPQTRHVSYQDVPDNGHSHQQFNKNIYQGVPPGVPPSVPPSVPQGTQSHSTYGQQTAIQPSDRPVGSQFHTSQAPGPKASLNPRTRAHLHSSSTSSTATAAGVMRGNPYGSAASTTSHTPTANTATASAPFGGAPSINAPTINAPSNEALTASNEDDALSQLQRHGALERQASKRYSSRRISRMANGGPADQLPTTGVHQRFLAPDYTDSSVVKERGPGAAVVRSPIRVNSPRHKRNVSGSSVTRVPVGGHSRNTSNSSIGDGGAPTNAASDIQRISSPRSISKDSPALSAALPTSSPAAPPAAPPIAPPIAPMLDPSKATSQTPQHSRSRNTSIDASKEPPQGGSGATDLTSLAESMDKLRGENDSTPPPRPMSQTFTGTPGTPRAAPDSNMINIFLRIGTKIRKAPISKPPSIAAIRLQFVEVGEYFHSSEGVFPDINIVDPQTNLEYELTEATVSDVVDGSLLVLQVKTPEETTIQSELKDLKDVVKELAQKVGTSSGPSGTANSGFNAAASRNTKFSSPVMTGDGRFKIEKPGGDRASPPPPGGIPRRDSASARGSASSSPSLGGAAAGQPFGQASSTGQAGGGPFVSAKEVDKAVADIKKLTSSTITQLRREIAHLRTEAKELANSSTHTIKSRSTIPEAMAQVDENTKTLIAQYEVLSDLIDAQRVSVGEYGQKLPQHELEKVRNELNQWISNVEQLENYVLGETPLWKKTWSDELNNVINEQKMSRNLEETIRDLHNDMDESRRIFDLVCEANKVPRKTVSNRRALMMAPPIAPGEEKNVADAVLHEIRGLDLNSEKRTEAMQKAERMHRMRAALRTEEFEYELGSFVTDNKLKPNGGMEAMERKREERERESRKLAAESEAQAQVMDKDSLEEKKLERKRAREEKLKAKQAQQGASESKEKPEVGSESINESDFHSANSSTADKSVPTTEALTSTEKVPASENKSIVAEHQPSAEKLSESSGETNDLSNDDNVPKPVDVSQAKSVNETEPGATTNEPATQKIEETDLFANEQAADVTDSGKSDKLAPGKTTSEPEPEPEPQYHISEPPAHSSSQIHTIPEEPTERADEYPEEYPTPQQVNSSPEFVDSPETLGPAQTTQAGSISPVTPEPPRTGSPAEFNISDSHNSGEDEYDFGNDEKYESLPRRNLHHTYHTPAPQMMDMSDEDEEFMDM